MAEQLRIEISADAQRLTSGLQSAGSALTKFGAVAGAIFGAGKLGLDLSQTGAESQRVARTFENLSGSAGQAAANLEAMERATRGLVSTTEQQQIANQLLGMNIATTAEELEKVVSVSRRLGSEFKGLGAKEAADDFALMISNMSVARLDSFGLSSGRVRSRIDELMASTEGMTREQAFFQATMEEADSTLARLGPELESTEQAVSRMDAAWANMISTLGESVEDTGVAADGINLLTAGIDGVAERIAILADARENLELIYLLIGGKGVDALRNSADALNELGINTEKADEVLGQWAANIDDIVNPIEDSTEALAEYHKLQLASFGQTTVDNIDEVTRAYNDQKVALEELAVRQARVDRVMQDRADQMAGGRSIEQIDEEFGTVGTRIEERKAAEVEAANTAESRWKSAFNSIKSAASSVIGQGLGVLGDLGLDFLGDDSGRAIGENARRLAAIAVGDFNGEAAQLLAQERPELFKKVMESEDPAATAQQMLRDFQMGIGAAELIDKSAAKERIKRILLGTAETDALINEISQELMAEGFAPEQVQEAIGQAGLGSGESVTKLIDTMGSAASEADYSKIGNPMAKGIVDAIAMSDAWGGLIGKVIEGLIGRGLVANPAAGRGTG